MNALHYKETLVYNDKLYTNEISERSGGYWVFYSIFRRNHISIFRKVKEISFRETNSKGE